MASKKLFLEGFAKVNAENLEVTDDVSVVEALNKPVKLTQGEYTNIKITTPEDLGIAEQILLSRGERFKKRDKFRQMFISLTSRK